MYISVNKLIVIFKKNKVMIRERPLINCYLHDLSRRCAMILCFGISSQIFG